MSMTASRVVCGFNAAELDATLYDGIEGVCLFAGTVDKTAAANVHHQRALGKLSNRLVFQTEAQTRVGG